MLNGNLRKGFGSWSYQVEIWKMPQNGDGGWLSNGSFIPIIWGKYMKIR